MPSLSVQVDGKVSARGRAIAVGTECPSLEFMKATLGHRIMVLSGQTKWLRGCAATRKLILVHQEPIMKT